MEDDVEKVLGWSETYPQSYIDAINAHPSWQEPRVIDRKVEKDLRAALQFIVDLPPGSRGAYGKFQEAQARVREALK